MKETRNILGWLGMAQEQAILQDAQRHVEETYKTVSFFTEAVKAFTQGDLQAKTIAIENVRDSEHKADILRSKMVSELSEGLLLPPDREDLIRFVKSLDRIADWTNGAARILGFIEEKPGDSILKNISLGTDLIFRSISRLKDALQSLAKNDFKKALEYCEEVDRIESEADDQKKTLIEAIIHAKLEPATLLLSFNLAEYLEGVTDKIEDAADFIKVAVIKSR
jgi:hypothetical protein